jgi:hypothetical protein
MKKFFLFVALVLLLPIGAEASTLSLSPATGVYTTGSTFTVRVVVNTKGAAINAADATLSFSPSELQVVSVSRASSIFNLWTTEPTFSNSAGTITFSGGSPTGYTGGSGTLMSVTFRTLGAGSPRVTVSSGSVLAADGRGTNVLTSMGSGAYTVSAVANTPTPEAIVEFVPPANTPGAPAVTSDTHSDQAGWSKETTAKLAWSLPGGVTAVRTLLDQNQTAIPTKVYDPAIRSIEIPELEDGVSYFHIQFKNEDGWGKVTHYRLAVDSTPPQNLALGLAPESNLAQPTQRIVATTTDTNGAPIDTFIVRVDGGETQTFKADNGGFTLENLSPGQHTLSVEVLDAAKNSVMTEFTFTIEAFDAPRFDDVPATISSGVTPVFSGVTRPKSEVSVTFASGDIVPFTLTAMSDESGVFRIIPDRPLADGTYEMTAVAKDEFGAVSNTSNPITFLVQPMGLVRIAGQLVDILSVVIPLVALIVLLGVMFVLGLARWRRFRGVVRRESREVLDAVHREFSSLRTTVEEFETQLTTQRKTKKLTILETEFIDSMKTSLSRAEGHLDKEAQDVQELTD